jgi:hypothetical protein
MDLPQLIPDLLAHIHDLPHVHGFTVEGLIIAAAGGAVIWIAARIYLASLAHGRR